MAKKEIDVPPEYRIYIKPEEEEKYKNMGVTIHEGPREGKWIDRRELPRGEEKPELMGAIIRNFENTVGNVIYSEDFSEEQAIDISKEYYKINLLRQKMMAHNVEGNLSGKTKNVEAFGSSSLNGDQMYLATLKDESTLYMKYVILEDYKLPWLPANNVIVSRLMKLFAQDVDKEYAEFLPNVSFVKWEDSWFAGSEKIYGFLPGDYVVDLEEIKPNEEAKRWVNSYAILSILVGLGDMHEDNYMVLPDRGMIIPFDLDFSASWSGAMWDMAISMTDYEKYTDKKKVLTKVSEILDKYEPEQLAEIVEKILEKLPEDAFPKEYREELKERYRKWWKSLRKLLSLWKEGKLSDEEAYDYCGATGQPIFVDALKRSEEDLKKLGVKILPLRKDAEEKGVFSATEMVIGGDIYQIDEGGGMPTVILDDKKIAKACSILKKNIDKEENIYFTSMRFYMPVPKAVRGKENVYITTESDMKLFYMPRKVHSSYVIVSFYPGDGTVIVDTDVEDYEMFKKEILKVDDIPPEYRLYIREPKLQSYLEEKGVRIYEGPRGGKYIDRRTLEEKGINIEEAMKKLRLWPRFAVGGKKEGNMVFGEDVQNLLSKINEKLKDVASFELIGGVGRKGYSFHDVDILVKPKKEDVGADVKIEHIVQDIMGYTYEEDVPVLEWQYDFYDNLYSLLEQELGLKGFRVDFMIELPEDIQKKIKKVIDEYGEIALAGKEDIEQNILEDGMDNVPKATAPFKYLILTYKYGRMDIGWLPELKDFSKAMKIPPEYRLYIGSWQAQRLRRHGIKVYRGPRGGLYVDVRDLKRKKVNVEGEKVESEEKVAEEPPSFKDIKGKEEEFKEVFQNPKQFYKFRSAFGRAVDDLIEHMLDWIYGGKEKYRERLNEAYNAAYLANKYSEYRQANQIDKKFKTKVIDFGSAGARPGILNVGSMAIFEFPDSSRVYAKPLTGDLLDDEKASHNLVIPIMMRVLLGKEYQNFAPMPRILKYKNKVYVGISEVYGLNDTDIMLSQAGEIKNKERLKKFLAVHYVLGLDDCAQNVFLDRENGTVMQYDYDFALETGEEKYNNTVVQLMRSLGFNDDEIHEIKEMGVRMLVENAGALNKALLQAGAYAYKEAGEKDSVPLLRMVEKARKWVRTIKDEASRNIENAIKYIDGTL